MDDRAIAPHRTIAARSAARRGPRRRRPDRVKPLRAAATAALDALDPVAIGRAYFEDPRGRFTPRQMRRFLDAGLEAAHVLAAARRTARIPARSGTTLLVGIGIAEIPVALAEARLGRRVLGWTKRGGEAAALGAALRAGTRVLCGCGRHASAPRVLAADAGRAPLPRGVSHLSLVSVVNDPEEFPALHDFYYHRAEPRTFSGRRFDADRRRARDLVARCLGALAPRALVTASDDAFPWIEEWAAAAGAGVEILEPRWSAPATTDPVRLLVVGRVRGRERKGSSPRGRA